MRKQFLRAKQVADQTLGRAEKTEVFTEELQNVDQRVEQLHAALHKCKAKLIECLRTKPSQQNLEKRKKKLEQLEEYQFAQFLQNDSKQILSDASLLGQVMSTYGESMQAIVDEMFKSETDIDKNVLERFNRYAKDENNIKELKAKLKTLTLDMDSAKARLASASADKVSIVQYEYDEACNKVENCKDVLATEMYMLAAREVEMANMFSVLIQTQMEYHLTISNILKKLLPTVTTAVGGYSRRPVYGCPLEDHLRFAKRDIAIVIETCCASLYEFGIDDEGLFRLSGVATKVKKLKASFDAGEFDSIIYDYDVHSIAGALKSYLRELPEPLMTHNLYNDWINSANAEGRARLEAVKAVLERLPKGNYDNLRYLIKFLTVVAAHSEHNKMSSANIAIVMAPNIIWSPTDGGALLGANVHSILVECLISNANYFFEGDVVFHSNLIPSVYNRSGAFGAWENDRITAGRKSPYDQPVNADNYQSPSQGKGATTVNMATVPMSSAARRPKPPAPLPPSGDNSAMIMSRSLNDGAFTKSGHHDDDSDSEYAEVPFEQAGDDVEAMQQSFNTTVEKSGGNRLSPDKRDISMGANKRMAPTQHSKSISRANVSTNRVRGSAHSSAEELNSNVEVGVATVDNVQNSYKKEDAEHLTNANSVKGHRKTNSLDRPMKPPPARPTTTTHPVIMNEKKSVPLSCERNPIPKPFPVLDTSETTGTASDELSDQITVSSSEVPHKSVNQQPSRPPLPAKSVLDKNSSGRSSFVKSADSVELIPVQPSIPAPTLTSKAGNFSVLKTGSDASVKMAPKAEISEADEDGDNLYDDVTVDLNSSDVKGRYRCDKDVLADVTKNDVDIINAKTRSIEATEPTDEIRSFKSRRSMFEFGNTPTDMMAKSEGANKIAKESGSHLLTVNEFVGSQAPPPRPKPPLPAKPKGDTVADVDMTRL